MNINNVPFWIVVHIDSFPNWLEVEHKKKNNKKTTTKCKTCLFSK